MPTHDMTGDAANEYHRRLYHTPIHMYEQLNRKRPENTWWAKLLAGFPDLEADALSAEIVLDDILDAEVIE